MYQTFYHFVSRLIWSTSACVWLGNIGIYVYISFLQIILGIQIALSIRIGQLLGEQDMSGAKTVARLAIVILG